MSLEFARKQGFKLEKIERPIYVRNMDEILNKERHIENTVEVNIYYQGYRKRMEINMIRGQKQNVILGMPWLAHHNPEIDQRMGKVKMVRCLEKCGKQQRLKQRKSEWQKQKEEKKRKKQERDEKRKNRKREKKPKKKKKIEVQKIAEEWEIWDKEKKAAKSEAEVKKLIPERFHKRIYVK